MIIMKGEQGESGRESIRVLAARARHADWHIIFTSLGTKQDDLCNKPTVYAVDILKV